jgi:hypothetical protein
LDETPLKPRDHRGGLRLVDSTHTEVTVMAKFKRFILALLLPGNVASLILYGRQVWSAVSLHSNYFPTPNPTVAAATANLDALQTQEALVPHGGPPAVKERNLKQAAVEADFIALKAYVLAQCLANPAEAEAIIAAANLRERKKSAYTKPFLAARMGPEQNQIVLRAKAVARRGVSYCWQYSLNGTVWVTIGTSTVANTSFFGSTPLTAYLFRFQATIKQTASAWSQTVSFTTP